MAFRLRVLTRAAHWLDRQPLWLVAVLGLTLGLGLGLPGFLALRAPAWAVAWLLLFGLLWRFGQQAVPVGTESPPVRTTPRRVRDGPLVMIDLPGGRFLMGSPESDDMAYDDEKPPHWVTLTAFRMAVTPVTAHLYHTVMQGQAPAAGNAQRPVVGVSWDEALRFCNRLSEQAGYRPCYRRRFGRWSCDWRASGYRLPTEAEWEYACRAGTTTRYSFGDDPARLHDYAWYGEDYPGQAHDVAQKLPNPWGLYDMYGNVWEWCWDRYGPYPAKAVTNPHGPSIYHRIKRSNGRVVRGGSAWSPPEDLRSAHRANVQPVAQDAFLGFRCVRVPPQPLDPLSP